MPVVFAADAGGLVSCGCECGEAKATGGLSVWWRPSGMSGVVVAVMIELVGSVAECGVVPGRTSGISGTLSELSSTSLLCALRSALAPVLVVVMVVLALSECWVWDWRRAE
jgi:hypothetical protein